MDDGLDLNSIRINAFLFTFPFWSLPADIQKTKPTLTNSSSVQVDRWTSSTSGWNVKWEQYLRRLPEPVQQRNISKSKWTWWRWLENLLWAATLNSGNHFKETSYYTVQVNEHQSLHYKMNLKNQNKREGPNIIPQMRLQREALVCST